MKIFLILVILFLSQTNLYSQYNLLAKWYLVYKEQDGTIKKTKGPFNTQIECEAARYTHLPFDAEYIGCYQ